MPTPERVLVRGAAGRPPSALAGSRGDGHAATTWFKVDPLSVSAARHHVTAVLTSWGVDDDCRDDAELLVSELAGNVVAHTEADSFGVIVDGSEGRIAISVQESASSPLPVPDTQTLTSFQTQPAPASTAVHGRGLAIIETLAVEWGISRAQASTSTWFALVPATTLPLSVVSPRAAAELELVQAGLRRTQMLLRITEHLSAATTAEQVSDAVTTVLGEHLGAMFTGIALIDVASLTGPHPTMRYLDLSAFPEPTRHQWARFDLATDAPVANVARTGTAEFHTDPAAAEAEHPGLADHMRTAGTQALAHLPLLADRVCHGTLAVAWAHPQEFDADTRALLTIVAGYAAQALNRRDRIAEAAAIARHRWAEASSDFDDALANGEPLPVLQRLDREVRRASEEYRNRRR
ncbi:ATP-binding protein [Jatrophihabitans sp. YIM 134969]